MGKKRIKKVEATEIRQKQSKKAKIKKHLAHGQAHIQSTYNNTIVTLTDLAGDVLAWSTAGSVGFKGAKKSTPYAAGLVVKNVVEKVARTGLKQVDVFVKGVGSGREAAIRALASQGLDILSIKDVTPIPHNGCRPPKVRRV